MNKQLIAIAVATAAGAFSMTTAAEAATVTFQNGANGYTGTEDVNIRSNVTTAGNLANAISLSIDNSDGGVVVQGLVQFTNIFGSGTGQIPLGSTINSASLSFTTGGPAGTNPESPGPVSLYRMIQSWNENSLWNTFGGNGIQFNNTEAASTATGSQSNILNPSTVSFNTLTDLQAWSNGTANNGWVLSNASNNGWDFFSSENGTLSTRPLLTVDFTAPAPVPTPALLPGLIGMGIAAIRKRK